MARALAQLIRRHKRKVARLDQVRNDHHDPDGLFYVSLSSPASGSATRKEGIPYTIRRWISASGILFDDSIKTKSADDAVKSAKRLAGIFKCVVDDSFEKKVMIMEPGEVAKLKKPSIKLTIHVKRTKK